MSQWPMAVHAVALDPLVPVHLETEISTVGDVAPVSDLKFGRAARVLPKIEEWKLQ